MTQPTTTPQPDTATDIRAGMTSASSAQADRLCPGRHLAQRGIPTAKESTDASSGSLQHLAFAGEDVKLNRSQKKTVDRGRAIEHYLVNAWLADFNASVDGAELMKRAHREQRLWLEHNGQRIHSAGIDAFWLTADYEHALVEDFKSLFGDIADAAQNEQLRDEAALIWHHFGCSTVTVFINQPGIRWKDDEQELVTYQHADLERAYKEMLERVLASNSINAKRVPGLEQCKFCRAAGTARCPESQKKMMEDATAPFDWNAASPSDRGEWVRALKTAEKSVEKALDAAKAAIEADPAAANGWGIKPGAMQRELKDILAVGAILADAYPDTMTPEKLTAMCSLSVPKLEELFEELAGQPLAKVRTQFDALFADLITKKQKAGSLAAVKS